MSSRTWHSWQFSYILKEQNRKQAGVSQMENLLFILDSSHLWHLSDRNSQRCFQTYMEEKNLLETLPRWLKGRFCNSSFFFCPPGCYQQHLYFYLHQHFVFIEYFSPKIRHYHTFSDCLYYTSHVSKERAD